MSRVLRVDATDPRITRTGEWFTIVGDGHALECHSPLPTCRFLLLFRGTGIKVYGKTNSLTNGTMYLELNGRPSEIPLNGTTFSDGLEPIYRVENMGNDDHQLIGSVASLRNGTFLMDHFEIETSSGDGFDLLSIGPTAQDVPAQALIMDNIDPAIIYHNQSQWIVPIGVSVGDYGGSASFTSATGASLSFSFEGVAIWFYGHICGSCGSFSVSFDGLTPQRLNGLTTSNSFDLVQRMIWSNTSLDPGKHTLNITFDDIAGKGLWLDFFRVLPGVGTSTSLSSFSTTNLGVLPTTVPLVPPTNQNQTNRVPLIVGLTLGLLVLVIVLCGVCYIYLRRRRRPIDAHPVSPYTGPPIRRADQQYSSMPQVRKGVPQPAQPSGSPMATVDLVMSSGVTGLGPPPSYETRSYDGRVDTAQ